MKKTATAVTPPPANDDQVAENWLTYKDRPTTMPLQELAVWMLTTNPNMAVSLLMSALEEHAAVPTGTQGKLVEVTVYDEEGNPEYNLTDDGHWYYDQTVTD